MLKILMSIDSKWANMIFDGTKKIELRKSRPKRKSPWQYTVVYLYDTHIKKVTGCFHTKIDDIYPIEQYGPEHIRKTKVDLLEYLMYSKHRTVYAWPIYGVVKFHIPIDIEKFNVKRPPQSWQYTEY